MKKLLIIFSAGFFCLLISCNSKKEGGSGMSEKAKKNLEASHIVNDAFTTGDTSKIDMAVAADFVNHTEHGDIMGRDSLKALIVTVKKESGDMKMTLMRELADDDYVFSEMNFTGTSDGSMMPKGPYDMHVIQVVKFKDGKGIEHWEYMRYDEMVKMMAPPPPPMDTMTHK